MIIENCFKLLLYEIISAAKCPQIPPSPPFLKGGINEEVCLLVKFYQKKYFQEIIYQTLCLICYNYIFPGKTPDIHAYYFNYYYTL